MSSLRESRHRRWGTRRGSLQGCVTRGKLHAVSKFFDSRVERLPGGPRSLGASLEALGLCDALYKAQSPALDAFFAHL